MIKTLKPIKIDASHESLEQHLAQLVKQHLYLPLVKIIGASSKLLNSTGLTSALLQGSVSYSDNKFVGKFNAGISKELKDLGAIWDNGWVIPSAQLPPEITLAIQQANRAAFLKVTSLLSAINEIDPDKLAEELVVDKFFDKSQFRMEQEFKSNIKALEIAPNLTPERTEVMRREYRDNIERSIKLLTAEQTGELRDKIQKYALTGGRHEGLKGTVQDHLKSVLQDSYNVSLSRVQLIARQETKLAMSTYTYDRYKTAGIRQYKWRCVAGTSAHPVRPIHKALDGKIFSFDDPPVTNEKGDRNNPQEDFNCRCQALPIIP
jgi:SPP1 gp7 family putative phage head morphogenesis protein